MGINDHDIISSDISKSLQSDEAMDIQRLQLIFSEKRTDLSLLRTGIAIFTLPLSVITVLIATSGQYELVNTLYLFVPLILLCIGLVILAIFLILKSMYRIKRKDALIQKIISKDPKLLEFYHN